MSTLDTNTEIAIVASNEWSGIVVGISSLIVEKETDGLLLFNDLAITYISLSNRSPLLNE